MNDEKIPDPTADIEVWRADKEMRDATERKKAYLRRYHTAELAEKTIQEEIDKLRLEKMFPALNQDGMPHGNTCMDLSEYAAQLDELLTELKTQMEKRIKIRWEITRKIEAMRDETEKTILRLRYIHWRRWDQIAEWMGYSKRNIMKIHERALRNFKM